jgi:hypothetical protein
LDPDDNIRGKQFERICTWYLEHHPVYAGQLSRVWLCKDWPGRWYPKKEAGIDLIAEHRDGTLWAIQAKVAVEVRGCFWHGCPDHYTAPSANRQFWEAKLARNIQRDQATQEALERAGWLLVVVWEHEDVAEAARRVAEAVASRRPTRNRACPNNV